jgi:hypothetical protein
MIDGEKHVTRITEIADWMQRKGDAAGDATPNAESMARPDQMQLARDEIAVRFKLLDKIMPNLKAVEHSGEIDNPSGIAREMSDVEIEHRLKRLARRRGVDIDEVLQIEHQDDAGPELPEFLK